MCTTQPKESPHRPIPRPSHIPFPDDWVPKCTHSCIMTERERILPLLAIRSGDLPSCPAQIACTRYTDNEELPARQREPPPSAFAVITLKASIGLTTNPCVSRAEYVSPCEERESFSCRAISMRAQFIPIRDDSKMVVNVGLHIAGAGLRRLGMAG
jgi:hypothetical protein